MIDEKICGTYWLVAMPDGTKYITTGEKPVKMNLNWSRSKGSIPWIPVECKDPLILSLHKMFKAKELTLLDFKGLKFPDITFDNEPIEIEIGKSGRVYTYESN